MTQLGIAFKTFALRYSPTPMFGELGNFVNYKITYFDHINKPRISVIYFYFFRSLGGGGMGVWDTLYTFNGFETIIQNSQFIILANKFTDVKVIMENIYLIEGLKLGLFN